MPKESYNNPGLTLNAPTEEFIFINNANMTCKITKCKDLLWYYRKSMDSFLDVFFWLFNVLFNIPWHRFDIFVSNFEQI